MNAINMNNINAAKEATAKQNAEAIAKHTDRNTLYYKVKSAIANGTYVEPTNPNIYIRSLKDEVTAYTIGDYDTVDDILHKDEIKATKQSSKEIIIKLPQTFSINKSFDWQVGFDDVFTPAIKELISMSNITHIFYTNYFTKEIQQYDIKLNKNLVNAARLNRVIEWDKYSNKLNLPFIDLLEHAFSREAAVFLEYDRLNSLPKNHPYLGVFRKLTKLATQLNLSIHKAFNELQIEMLFNNFYFHEVPHYYTREDYPQHLLHTSLDNAKLLTYDRKYQYEGVGAAMRCTGSYVTPFSDTKATLFSTSPQLISYIEDYLQGHEEFKELTPDQKEILKEELTEEFNRLIQTQDVDGIKAFFSTPGKYEMYCQLGEQLYQDMDIRVIGSVDIPTPVNGINQNPQAILNYIKVDRKACQVYGIDYDLALNLVELRALQQITDDVTHLIQYIPNNAYTIDDIIQYLG